jgi:hemolysin activation/secretion protein
VLGPRAVARLEASALAGRDLDRFSRFGFDAFDSRLRGYPSAGVRFDRGMVLRSAATWPVRRGWRLDGFVDAALVHDPTAGQASHRHLGAGGAVEVALPGRILLNVDWGFGFEGRDREGRRGTHVVRVTAYKVL